MQLVEQQAAHIRILERRNQSLRGALALLEESAEFRLPSVEVTDRHPSGDPQLESWHTPDASVVAKACARVLDAALQDGTLEELCVELEKKP